MSNNSICVIGLGYVGLPLAIEFGKKFITIGFDINEVRIEKLKKKIDINNEIDKNEFTLSSNLQFTNEIKDAQNCNYFIITVPTPVNENNHPDFEPLILASKMVGSVLKKKRYCNI